MAHYVHDENNNRILAYSAEEVLSVLAQAIEDGDLDNITADAAFITRLKSIADGSTYFVAFLTQAEYNALEQADELNENTIYYITDDSTLDDLQTAFEQLQVSTSDSILGLQQSVGHLNEFENQVTQYINGAIGVSLPVSTSAGTGGKYVHIGIAGLYACVIKDPSDNSRDTRLISVSALSDEIYGDELLYSSADQSISYTGRGNFDIEYCHLVVAYKGA